MPRDPHPEISQVANPDILQVADALDGLSLYTGMESSGWSTTAGASKGGVVDVLYMHPDMQKRVQDGRRQEAMRQAEDWRVLHQGKAGRSSWFHERGCWLLCQLGHLLVWVGQQLEGYGLSQPA